MLTHQRDARRPQRGKPSTWPKLSRCNPRTNSLGCAARTAEGTLQATQLAAPRQQQCRAQAPGQRHGSSNGRLLRPAHGATRPAPGQRRLQPLGSPRQRRQQPSAPHPRLWTHVFAKSFNTKICEVKLRPIKTLALCNHSQRAEKQLHSVLLVLELRRRCSRRTGANQNAGQPVQVVLSLLW